MDRHILFTQKCWSFALPHHEEYKRLINQILLVDKNDPNFRLYGPQFQYEKDHFIKTNEQTNVYAWRSDWHSDTHFPILRNLCDEVKPFITKIIEEEKIRDTSAIEVNACWINKFKKNDFAVPHQHEPGGWSAVYFMSIPQGSSTFRVHNPMNITYNSELKENYAVLDINASEGSVLIMSGNLRHSVTPNLSEETRTTVAMNFRIFEKFPHKAEEK